MDREQFEAEKKELDADRARLLAVYGDYYEKVRKLTTEYLKSQRQFAKEWKSIAREADKAGKKGSIAYDLEDSPMHPDNITSPIDPDDLKAESRQRKACLEDIERVYTDQLEDLKDQYL
jgi:hypothetical protein